MMSFTLNTYENPYIVKAPDYSSIQVKKSNEMIKKKFKKDKHGSPSLTKYLNA